MREDELRRRMGHSDRRMLDVYVRLVDEDMTPAMPEIAPVEPPLED
jgi:hypothetical protein